MEPVLKLRKIIKYYDEDWYIDNDYTNNTIYGDFQIKTINNNNKNYKKKKKKRKKKRENTQRGKTSFQKEEAENADLYEAALNKIMSTYK